MQDRLHRKPAVVNDKICHQRIFYIMMKITKAQLRAARALMGWSLEQLGKEAGVGWSTVQRLESSKTELKNAKYETVEKVIDALTRAGIEFIPGGVRKSSSDAGDEDLNAT